VADVLSPLVLSLLFVIGFVVIVTPPSPVPVAPRSGSGRQRMARLLAALGAGGLLFVLSGWVLPAVVAVAAIYWLVAGWQGRQRSASREIARLDSIASWIENVRDVLMAGEQPIGAITSTVTACPPLLRPHVRRLAIGLGRQDPAIAFRRFADEIDDPVGDLVAAGLSIAVVRGARTVRVLSALAEQTRQQVERRRLIEAERAPSRREVQALTLIMSALVVALMVFGRSQYLDAYDTGGGQLFLAASLAGYAALIVRVQRLAQFPRPARFITASSNDHPGSQAW
jgi:tight adherence protein B